MSLRLFRAIGTIMCVLFIPLCGSAASSMDDRSERLVANGGKSDYAIIVPNDADSVVSYAAGELRHFLAEISGADLNILKEKDAAGMRGFILGPCKRISGAGLDGRIRQLREDGVLIKTVGPDIVLRGQNDRGQLYSVYVLLERFTGVRFLARDCTIIPRQDRLVLPEIDYAYSPPFMYRETLYFDSFPMEIAARQRLNGPYSQCDAEVGGKIQIHPYVHSFSKLVPPDEYFNEHPEYFSLVNGNRTNLTVHGQLCLTNPDVLEIAKRRVLKWIEENPDVPIFDVSQNDGNGPCECENCMAVVQEEGSQHGPILRFVNAIADEVAKDHPDLWIETLAYAYSTKPPAVTKPRKNVIIRLCHAGCYFHGFEDCGLGANFAGYLDEWSKVTENIFIWHYATNFAHYIAPCQNLDGLAKGIRYYASHNVRGLMVQCDYQSPGGELAELRQYLAAQLMWDPNREPKEIVREFCRGYYGAASVDVLGYLALANKEAESPQVHAFGAWDPKGTVSPTFVAKGLKFLERTRLRTLRPEETNRVERLLLPLWYMQLTYPDEYGLPAIRASDLLKEFRRIVKANNITHISEGESIEAWLARMESRFSATGPE